MQNTAVNTRLYSSAGLCGRTICPAYDLMIPRKGEAMLPVIFLNREIPEILPRILREYERLTSEARLSGRLCGIPRSRIPAPLISWYGSVLGNVYESTGAVRRNPKDISFALSCVLFTPEEHSEYYYAELDLPPLWKKEADRHCESASLFAGKDRHCESAARLIFRYRSDTGSWYACILRRGRLRNVFSQYVGTKKSPGA